MRMQLKELTTQRKMDSHSIEIKQSFTDSIFIDLIQTVLQCCLAATGNADGFHCSFAFYLSIDVFCVCVYVNK